MLTLIAAQLSDLRVRTVYEQIVVFVVLKTNAVLLSYRVVRASVLNIAPAAVKKTCELLTELCHRIFLKDKLGAALNILNEYLIKVVKIPLLIIAAYEFCIEKELKQHHKSYPQMRKHIGNSAVECYLFFGQTDKIVFPEFQKHLREFRFKDFSVIQIFLLEPVKISHHYPREYVLLCAPLVHRQLFKVNIIFVEFKTKVSCTARNRDARCELCRDESVACRRL